MIRSPAILLLAFVAGCDRTCDCSARDALYVAASDRSSYHRKSCEWGKKIALADLECFARKIDAEVDGHSPCKVCEP